MRLESIRLITSIVLLANKPTSISRWLVVGDASLP